MEFGFIYYTKHGKSFIKIGYKMFSKKCKQHLNDADMTAWQHFCHAMGIAFALQTATLAVVIHAFVPRSFTTYASDCIKKMAKCL